MIIMPASFISSVCVTHRQISVNSRPHCYLVFKFLRASVSLLRSSNCVTTLVTAAKETREVLIEGLNAGGGGGGGPHVGCR